MYFCQVDCFHQNSCSSSSSVISLSDFDYHILVFIEIQEDQMLSFSPTSLTSKFEFECQSRLLCCISQDWFLRVLVKKAIKPIYKTVSMYTPTGNREYIDKKVRPLSDFSLKHISIHILLSLPDPFTPGFRCKCLEKIISHFIASSP